MALTRKKKLELAAQLEELFGPDRSVIEHEFPDGWTIRRCLTYGDLCREGRLMSNCWSDLFWRDPTKRQGYPYGAGMNEHFKCQRAPKRRLQDKDIRNPTTRRGYAVKLKRTRYFSVRDPDNIPRCSFFSTPGRGEVASPGGPHNNGIKYSVKIYLGKFQVARKGTTRYPTS